MATTRPDNTIYLVRHGETDANRAGRFAGRTNEPLTERGRRQAREAAMLMNDAGIRLIHASPLSRTMETAAIISSLLRIKVREEPALLEISIPWWDGRLKDELESDPASGYSLWKKEPAGFSLPGAETLSGLQERAVSWLDHVRAIEDRGPIAAVTHMAVIRVLLLHAMGRPLSDYRLIKVPNASPLALDIKNDHYCVRYLQDTPTPQEA